MDSMAAATAGTDRGRDGDTEAEDCESTEGVLEDGEAQVEQRRREAQARHGVRLDERPQSGGHSIDHDRARDRSEQDRHAEVGARSQQRQPSQDAERAQGGREPVEESVSTRLTGRPVSFETAPTS